MKRTLLVALSTLVFGHAGATTVTFSEFAHDDPYTLLNPITSGGFIFTNSRNSSDGLGIWGRNTSYQADPGNAAVFVNYGYTTTTMAQVGGGVFDFISIDLADAHNSGICSTIEFIFKYSDGGSANQSVTLDHAIGLQTFVFNQTGLDSISWRTIQGDNGWNQFDNVVTDEGGQGSEVPEPATLCLLGLGLVGLLYRRKSSNSAHG